MLVAREKTHVRALRVHRRNETLLDELGWTGLFRVVWRCTPLLIRPIALPYGLVVYGSILAASQTLLDMRTLHFNKYESSFVFRCLRPRYRKVKGLLGDRS